MWEQKHCWLKQEIWVMKVPNWKSYHCNNMCYKQACYIFVLLFQLMYFMFQSKLFESLRGIQASAAHNLLVHQTSLYVKKETAEYQYMNDTEAGILHDINICIVS